jgi:hypothetical protein
MVCLGNIYINTPHKGDNDDDDNNNNNKCTTLTTNAVSQTKALVPLGRLYDFYLFYLTGP